MADLDSKLNNFLNKKVVNRKLEDGSVESCDLETGECKIIKYRDGLIERNDRKVVRNSVSVETVRGEIKNLLND
jgi:hypothetical protein